MNLKSLRRFLEQLRNNKTRRQSTTRTSSLSPQLEHLEDRTAPAVLPPVVNSQELVDAGGYDPVIAQSPTSPNKMVLLYSRSTEVMPGEFFVDISGQYSVDGGENWVGFGLDPFTAPGNPNAYPTMSEPTIAFNRDNEFYVGVVGRDDMTSEGALLLYKFDFTENTPVQIDLDSRDAGSDVNVLYRWVGQDPALNPVIAVNNNTPNFTDPSTGEVVQDPLASRQEDVVYVVWNTDATQPMDSPAIQPNAILLAMSVDGGETFSTPQFVSDTGYAPTLDPLDPIFGAVHPQVLITQGTSFTPETTDEPSVAGGQLTIVWENVTGLADQGGITIDRSDPVDGVAEEDPLLVVQEFSSPSVGPTLGMVNDGVAQMTGPDVAGSTDFSLDVRLRPDFDVLSDLDVTIAMVHPNMSHVQVELISPTGVVVELIRFGVDGANANIAGQGLPNIPDLGMVSGEPVGTTFNQDAPRIIDDTINVAPYVAHYRPEGGTLDALNGLAPAQLNGRWTLRVSDSVEDVDPPTQYLSLWGMKFVSRIDTTGFGGDELIVGGGTAALPIPNSPTDSASNPPYPYQDFAQPLAGIAPSLSFVQDAGVGDFNPNQGRLYLAYTGANVLANPPANVSANQTDIFLLASDDGGVTWDALVDVNGVSPVRLNQDDLTDNFSEGLRPQFMPELAVDPLTGSLTAMWYDGRYDASGGRVATFLATSTDGGETWSDPVFLNPAMTSTDAITGEAIAIEPIPSNFAVLDPFAPFDHNALLVFGGNVFPFWAGNLNEDRIDLWTADVTVPAGPVVVDSTTGAVVEQYQGLIEFYRQFLVPGLGNAPDLVLEFPGIPINTEFALDGTRQVDGFIVQFDRPVDPATISPEDIALFYRDPRRSVDDEVDLSAAIMSVIPLDENLSQGVGDPGTVPLVHIGDAFVVEPNEGDPEEMAHFDVLLSMPLFDDVIIEYETADRLATTNTDSSDYTPQMGSVTIPAGALSTTISVPVRGDQAIEGREDFLVQLTKLSIPTLTDAITDETTLTMVTDSVIQLGRSEGLGTIIDNERTSAITIGNGILKEGDSGVQDMVFPVFLSLPSPTNTAITVNYATADNSAVEGLDYLRSTGTVTFNPGAVSATLSVPIVGDQEVERNETFFVRLTDAVGGVIGREEAIGVIVGDDLRGVSTGNVTILEDDAVVSVPVILNAPADQDVVVDYQIFNGTATFLSDFTTQSGSVFGSVTIPAGQLETSIEIMIQEDTIYEFDGGLEGFLGGETFGVDLLSSTNASILPTAATSTIFIVDDDVGATLYIDDVVVREGDDVTTQVEIPLVLSHPIDQELGITYATREVPAMGVRSPATADVDYVSSSGMFIIPPGSESITLSIPINGDLTPELNEVFEVQWTLTSGTAQLDRAATEVQIVDNDAYIHVGEAFVRESDGATTVPLTYELRLNTPRDVPVSVTVNTTPGTATAGGPNADYVPLSQVIMFAPGEVLQFATVMANGDNNVEVNETVNLTLSNPVNAQLWDRETGDIGTGPLTVQGTIIDNDDDGTNAPLDIWSIDDVMHFERDAVQTDFVFTISTREIRTVDREITYATAMGVGPNAAMPGVHFTPMMGMATVPAGQSSVQVTVPFVDDPLPNGSRFFLIQLTNPPTGQQIVDAEGVGYIIDDDGLNVVVGRGVVVEGDTGTVDVSVPVLLSNPAPFDVRIGYDFIPGSALQELDYEGAGGNITIPAGEVSATITIPIVGDFLTERGPITAPFVTEQFTIDITSVTPSIFVNHPSYGPAFAFPPNTGTVTILDNDFLGFVVGDVTVREGTGGMQEALVPVSLTGESGVEVSVRYETLDGTALAGSDYEAQSGVLTFPAGDTTIFIRVPITTDEDNEGNEEFQIRLFNSTGASITRPLATARILDDDLEPALTVSDSLVRESPTAAVTTQFTVFASFPPLEDLTFDVSTSDVTATVGSDYLPVSGGTRFIPAGATSTTFNVTVLNDTLEEGNEEFRVTLSNPGLGATIERPNGVGIIVDPEFLPTLTVQDIVVDESDYGTTEVLVKVELSEFAANRVSFDYETIAVTATGGADYVVQTGSVFIPAGQKFVNIPITVSSDTLKEDMETFLVRVSNVTGAAFVAKRDGVVSIVDDDGRFGATTFLVEMTPQGATGTYSYSVGSDIRDRIRFPQPVAIPTTAPAIFNDPFDEAINLGETFGVNPRVTTSSRIEVPSLTDLGKVVGDVNVTFSLNHTAINELTIKLKAPDGTEVVLVDRVGFPGQRFAGTTLDDSSNVPIANGTGTFTGTFQPSESLGRFLGAQVGGTWELIIEDANGLLNSGALQAWSLEITPTDPTVVSSNDLNQSFGTTQLGTTQIVTLDVPAFPAGVTIADLTTSLTFTHDDLSEVGITLRSPNNTELVLVDQQGSPGNSFTNTTFDDQAVTSITSGSGTFTGSFLAQGGLLSRFDGENPAGTWQLIIEDTNGTANVGQLVDWTLDITPTAPVLTGTENAGVQFGGQLTPNILTSTIEIPNLPGYVGLQDLNVTLNLDHARLQDVRATLIAPDGTRVTLVDQRGSTGNQFVGTLFDDEARNPISAGLGTFTASFRPETPLSALDGLAPGGTWTLELEDLDPSTFTLPGDPTPIESEGQLVSWSLDLTPYATTFSSRNGFNQDFGVGTLPLTFQSKVDFPALPEDLTIAEIRVTLNVQHQAINETNFWLIAPNGEMVQLVERVGNPGDSFVNTVLTDQGTLPISSGSGTFTQEFVPVGRLSRFNNLPPEGTWTLVVEDVNGNANGGTLQSWALTVVPGVTDGASVLGNTMDQNTNGEVFEENGDVYVTPGALDGVPFSTPTDMDSLPLIVPGPHVVNVQVPGQEPGPEAIALQRTTSAIDITFSRPINPATFTPADIVRMVGPTGAVTGPFTVTPNPIPGDLSNRVFRIGFPEQVVGGYYTIVLGSDISDFSGVPGILPPFKIDSNGNAGVYALQGTDPTSLRTESRDYSSTTPVFIPASQTVQTSLTVPDNFIITQTDIEHIQLQLNITHPQAPDLQARLISPTGSVVPLFTNVGGSGFQRANFADTLFDDFAQTALGLPSPIQSGLAPFEGPYNPQTPLSVLVGELSGGTWTLEVTNTGVSTGVLNYWTLTLPENIPGTGLGEPVADQTSLSFRIFNLDQTRPESAQSWTPIGPLPLNENVRPEDFNPGDSIPYAGPITALAVDPTDPSGNTVYAGFSFSGLWVTYDFLTQNPQGPTWIPLTDFGEIDGLTISHIEVISRNNDPTESIILVGTGVDDAPQNNRVGVGFLRSLDGGQTWDIIDSTNNVDADGDVLPFNDAGRDHIFSASQIAKIEIDPNVSGLGEAIIYAAVQGPNEGLYRSTDSGDTWELLRSGTATDVLLAQGSVGTDGFLQRLYASFQGEGVFTSSNAPSAAPEVGAVSGLRLMDGGAPPDRRQPIAGNPTISVGAPPDTPTGGTAKIVLAAPSKADSPLENLTYSGWLYAWVVDGANEGLYMTKDFGLTWTQVQLPGAFANDLFGSNDDTRGTTGRLTGATEATSSMVVDPNNPNVVYLASGDFLVRVDVTKLEDVYSLVGFDNNDAGGAVVETATTGAATVIDPTMPYGLLTAFPPDPNNPPPPRNNLYNLIRDPDNPFLQRVQLIENVSDFTNLGEDAQWMPFDEFYFFELGQSYGNHEVIATTDLTTGDTRLLLGNDRGVFTGVDSGDGTLSQGSAIRGTINGSRNGNFQVSSLVSISMQPSALAADMASALIYATSLDAYGSPSAPKDLLTNGDLSWTVDEGADPLGGSYVQAAPSGSGLVYQYAIPDTISGNLSAGDFFQRIDLNGRRTSRVFGLTEGGGVGTQWPTSGPGSTFAINLADPNAFLMSSQDGRLFRTTNEGVFWEVVAEPTDLDGTYAGAVAFGAPDATAASGVLSNYMFAGTEAGNIYGTVNGDRGPWVDISNGLDGSRVLEIIPNPARGTRDAYALTEAGVYYISDARESIATGGTIAWTDITNDLTSLTKTHPFDETYTDLDIQLPNGLTDMVIDWRYETPRLYVSAFSGVYRSKDDGETWTYFPDVDEDGAPDPGGYLPHGNVLDLDLSIGNVNNNSGLVDDRQGYGHNMLLASIDGRGVYAIRIDTDDLPVIPATLGPAVTEVVNASPTNDVVNVLRVTFDGPVDPGTFGPDDLTLRDPSDTPVTILDVRNVDPNANNSAPNPFTVYEIVFVDQTAAGVYDLRIGPDLSDFAGNLMNQDKDLIRGEIVEDAFFTSLFFNNQPPVISPIMDQVVNVSQSTGPLAFTVTDEDQTVSPPSVTATFTATTSPAVVTSSGIRLVNFGNGNWTIEVTPVANVTGSATIFVTARDDNGVTTTMSFQVVVNTAPTLTPLPDQTFSHVDDTIEEPLFAADVDPGATLTFLPPQVFPYELLFDLDERLGLERTDPEYFFNSLGQGERWLWSSVEQDWYVITPAGFLFRAPGGRFIALTAEAEVGIDVYNDPTLLYLAPKPTGTVSNVNAFIQASSVVGRGTLVVDPIPPIGGRFFVEVSVTDGFATASDVFVVTITNENAPVFPFSYPDITTFHTDMNIVVNQVQATDTDGDTVTITPKIDTQLSDLDETFGFFQLGGTYYQNFTGVFNEKWIRSATENTWFWLLPNGNLHRTAGNGLGALVEFVGVEVYDDPSLLHEAPEPLNVANDQVFQLVDSRLTINPQPVVDAYLEANPRPEQSFTFVVALEASDGSNTTVTKFSVTLTNARPAFPGIPAGLTVTDRFNRNVPLTGGAIETSHTNFPLEVLGVRATDADNDVLSVTRRAWDRDPTLFNLDTSLGLFQLGGTYYTNSVGQNEKWVRSGVENSWYVILPTGAFVSVPDGATVDAVNNTVATLGVEVYDNPALLHEAQPPVDLTNIVISAPGERDLPQNMEPEANEVNLASPEGFTSFVLELQARDPFTVEEPTVALINVKLINTPPEFQDSPDNLEALARGSDPIPVVNGEIVTSPTSSPLRVEGIFARDSDLGDVLPTVTRRVFDRDPTLFNLDTSLGLFQLGGTYYTNSVGQNEKWVRSGVENSWYVILPTGAFVSVPDGATVDAVNNTVANLGVEVYDNPALLHEAQPPVDLTNPVSGTPVIPLDQQNVNTDFVELDLQQLPAGVESVVVVVSASDNFDTSTTSFRVTLTGNAPVFANFNNQPITLDSATFNSTGLLVTGVQATDLDPFDAVTVTRRAYNRDPLLFALDQRLGLFQLGGSYYTNSVGQNEKWIRSGLENSWYVILPEGELVAVPDGSTIDVQNNTVANVGIDAYTNPALLHQALQPVAVGNITVSDPDANLNDVRLTGTGFSGIFYLGLEADDDNPLSLPVIASLKVTVN